MNQTFYMNICANSSLICAANKPGYYSHGAAIEFFGPVVPPCANPAQSGCFDWDTMEPVCCTADCELLAPGSFVTYSFLDAGNPAGGISIAFAPMPSVALDPFDCPINPVTGLARLRQLRVDLACDDNGASNTLTDLFWSEPSTCFYLATAKSKAACGALHPPPHPAPTPEPPIPPSTVIIFVVIGACGLALAELSLCICCRLRCCHHRQERCLKHCACCRPFCIVANETQARAYRVDCEVDISTRSIAPVTKGDAAEALLRFEVDLCGNPSAAADPSAPF